MIVHDQILPSLYHMQRQGRIDRARVIIRVVPGGRQALSNYLNSQSGHRIVVEHPLIDAITADIPLRALAGLENNPFVATVSIDAALAGQQLTTTKTPKTGTSFVRSMLGVETTTLTEPRVLAVAHPAI